MLIYHVCVWLKLSTNSAPLALEALRRVAHVCQVIQDQVIGVYLCYAWTPLTGKRPGLLRPAYSDPHLPTQRSQQPCVHCVDGKHWKTWRRGSSWPPLSLWMLKCLPPGSRGRGKAVAIFSSSILQQGHSKHKPCQSPRVHLYGLCHNGSQHWWRVIC